VGYSHSLLTSLGTESFEQATAWFIRSPKFKKSKSQKPVRLEDSNLRLGEPNDYGPHSIDLNIYGKCMPGQRAITTRPSSTLFVSMNEMALFFIIYFGITNHENLHLLEENLALCYTRLSYCEFYYLCSLMKVLYLTAASELLFMHYLQEYATLGMCWSVKPSTVFAFALPRLEE
jgi:hypothetical protein